VAVASNYLGCCSKVRAPIGRMPWLSELDVPECQELAGDPGWGGGRC
jgi:hypothetical protein